MVVVAVYAVGKLIYKWRVFSVRKKNDRREEMFEINFFLLNILLIKKYMALSCFET